MKCLDCKHWNLKGSPLRAAGFGLCKAETEERFRVSRTFAPVNICRFGNFAQATAATVAARGKALAP
jgi:hypothetical protein